MTVEYGEPSDRSAAVERLLTKGTVDVIVRDELRQKLLGETPLRVKLGFDPTRPDIHLGHYAVLRKLREFQQLGHEVIVIIGDWTAMIGDPSGMSAQRKMLEAEEVQRNAQTYLEQVFKVLNPERTKVVWQSSWYKTFGLADVIRLTSKYTVAQMLAREDFAKRFSRGAPIAITEFLYPLLQAYDSVAIRANVEIGGTDQLFNLLVGREIQREMGMEPQHVLTVPILVGTDGVQKMSKSLGNYIAITESPREMFGKLMSIPDEVMGDYLRLLTDYSTEEIDRMLADAASGAVNPRDIKERMALAIVTDLHGAEAAEDARAEFERIFRRRETPEEMPEVSIPGEAHIVDVLLTAGMAKTRNEARRLITQGGVRLAGERIEDTEQIVRIKEPRVLQVGKRRFIQLIPAP
ncbi:tyrosine--tRNA ligase [Nitrolancea hollandica]|uniref:Tyrosine--tRNA ligase n=1 Tax=Nitrolancea hollandica Lb TaxID=1129897 RepID=I4EEE7_9BACT|nr:tyrosine--tRNA ligase [Nitrolancea hollandica]CCF83059.1 Tyrosyl-tRNA synthetase [Nitrolancea hollandica Lb]